MEEFSELVGKTIVGIRHDGDIFFTLSDGTECRLYHDQDCCESVSVESIDGTLSEIVGSPLIVATEETPDLPPPSTDGYGYDSYTWTIYTLATATHRVVIRWFGESNGYYSEDVRFVAT